MNGSRTLQYVLEHDPQSGIYTGYCPNMRPVRFSSKDEQEVHDLVSRGIKLYLKKHPDFFDAYKELEV